MPHRKKKRSIPRYAARVLDAGFDQTSFVDEVRQGLTASPKALSPKFLYDELGSQLFDAICLLPEYYPTRTESVILAGCADEIVSCLPAPLRIVELGSGSSIKTRHLLEAQLRRQETLTYIPIDVSEAPIERSSRELLHTFRGLSVQAYVADYFDALEHLAVNPPVATGDTAEVPRTLALFLGSTIGNMNHDEGVELLRAVHRILVPGDGLLLGADLKKSLDVLLPAYNDALGVTAAFNKNLLVRFNRELGGHFDLDCFRHEARWNEAESRVEMHLVSCRAHTVRLDELDLDINFDEGESIHAESSHKFDLAQLHELAAASGFRLERSWFDPDRRFSENLLIAV